MSITTEGFYTSRSFSDQQAVLHAKDARLPAPLCSLTLAEQDAAHDQLEALGVTDRDARIGMILNLKSDGYTNKIRWADGLDLQHGAAKYALQNADRFDQFHPLRVQKTIEKVKSWDDLRYDATQPKGGPGLAMRVAFIKEKGLEGFSNLPPHDPNKSAK